ncbi:MAG: hypothetical protein JW840_06250 [Candidatus Thermoplasmatota archaeon]|nr:hypothetical protein [Candidatus Thermoplasmatota archaeon]
MNKHLLPITLIILVTFGLSGCQEKAGTEKLLGTWAYQGTSEYHTDSFTFYQNGSVYCLYHWPGSTILEHQWNEYTISDDKLLMGQSVYTFEFKENDKILLLNGEVYHKK